MEASVPALTTEDIHVTALVITTMETIVLVSIENIILINIIADYDFLVCLLSCENSGNVTSDCTGCICPAWYTGNTCETVIDPCVSLDPCGLYGTCSSNRTEYMCQCHEGWSGPHCQDCAIENCDRCSGIPPICQSCMEGYVIDETGTYIFEILKFCI